jgi:hypothetical protein
MMFLICSKNLKNKLLDFFNPIQNLYSLCKMNKALMVSISMNPSEKT